MPPKRKTETVPEPSPPPKKRSTKTQAASDKKRPREETVAAATKPRRKKKVEEEEEVEEKEPTTPVVTTPSENKSAKAATTPVVKSGPKSVAPVTTPATSLKSASKAPRSRSRKSVVRIDLPAEEGSAKKSATPVASAAPSPKTRTPLRMPTTPVPISVAAQPEPGTDDEKEIVSLWNQTFGALNMCLTFIGPTFLIVILGCYFMGMMQKSQAIATVGVVYTFLFLSIMGSYTLVILPCILVSRLFTCLVSPHATSHTAAEINLYSRLLVLLSAAAGLGYYFLHHQG